MHRQRPLFRIVLIGTLLAALGLSGCGRKGQLDPPPAASAVPQAGANAEGQPVAPPGPRKRIPLDALLN